MEKQSVVLRFPKVLLERVDAFMNERGFGTRTQAIFYLINYALDSVINDDSNNTK
jgi:metal-responsive CopG/Arc/MetJ family transcriptional regulator